MVRRLLGRHSLGTAAVAALLFTGCAEGTHPGAAAVVGDAEISVGRVDEVSRAMTGVLGQPFTTQLTLNELIRSELTQQVGAKRSISTTPAQIDQATRAFLPDPALYQKIERDPVAFDFLRTAAVSALVAVKLGGEKGLTNAEAQRPALQAGNQIVLEEADKIGVTVSPRFGKWSGDEIAAVSGSLSVESEQTKQRRAQTEQQQQQPQG